MQNQQFVKSSKTSLKVLKNAYVETFKEMRKALYTRRIKYILKYYVNREKRKTIYDVPLKNFTAKAISRIYLQILFRG